ncbi:MAG: hypothetical protein ACKV2O_17480, partial [Acidimicrobiales bacterium]
MTTLLELVETLARDPQAKAAYDAAPDAYLARNGFGDLSPAELNEAVLHSAEVLPPLVSAQFGPDGGLDAVSGADPAGFDQRFTSDYEEDLFGLDQDSPIFADGELSDTPQDDAGFEADRHADGDLPVEPQAILPELLEQPAQRPDTHTDTDTDTDPESLRHLFDGTDPHGLDAEPGLVETDAPPAPASAPLSARAVEFEPAAEAFPDPFDDHQPDQGTEPLTDSTLTSTDLFEEAHPLTAPVEQPLLDAQPLLDEHESFDPRAE